VKQLSQCARTGEIRIEDVPGPQLLSGTILVRNRASLVSVGTERMLLEFGGKNLLKKAAARPDLVKHVIQKARRDGVISAWQAANSRLDQPLPLGYSSAGAVTAVADDVIGFQVGDGVACAGFGYASHAEIICVPRLLAAVIPAGSSVPFEHAAFTTVGAIALHGIRQSGATLGERVAVIGLGLLGQLTVQILKAAGCRVVGMDPQAARAELARRMGAEAVAASAEELKSLCKQLTGSGADAVLITADTTSDEPVQVAGEIARDRAVVVAVGAVGMNVPRKVYYEKELDFRISRSYGPGRYDADFEARGHDYPIGFVRWTETRNMEAFLRLCADGKLDLEPLISHLFPIEKALDAYDLITGKSGQPFLGVILTYTESPAADTHITIRKAKPRPTESTVRIGMIGAGNFAMSMLLPAIKGTPGTDLVAVCTATGLKARYAADKFSFSSCTTNADEVFKSPNVNTVLIATRHNLHAPQTLSALQNGKDVFCEKPLCMNETELAAIVRVSSSSGRRLMVGYNRRFAPLAVRLKDFFDQNSEPIAVQYRVNAGFIPRGNWVHDPTEGGGRIIGELCHFVDFLIFLTRSLPVRVSAHALPDSGRYSSDNVIVAVDFDDGSVGTIAYVANGDKAFSKERIEMLGGGAAAVLEDFRSLELVRGGRATRERSRMGQDKGHRGEWQAFAEAIRTGAPSPIPLEQIVASTLATFSVLRSRETASAVAINTSSFIAASLANSPAPATFVPAGQ
jgi:predicted dehydrogenase